MRCSPRTRTCASLTRRGFCVGCAISELFIFWLAFFFLFFPHSGMPSLAWSFVGSLPDFFLHATRQSFFTSPFLFVSFWRPVPMLTFPQMAQHADRRPPRRRASMEPASRRLPENHLCPQERHVRVHRIIRSFSPSPSSFTLYCYWTPTLFLYCTLPLFAPFLSRESPFA